MELKRREQKNDAVRIYFEEENKEVGHVYLYFIHNDGHDVPYAYIEDLFVREENRGKGIGGKLIEECLRFAKEKKCYKIIATSRYEREHVHKMYEKFGFAKTGYSFRKNRDNEK